MAWITLSKLTWVPPYSMLNSATFSLIGWGAAFGADRAGVSGMSATVASARTAMGARSALRQWGARTAVTRGILPRSRPPAPTDAIRSQADRCSRVDEIEGGSQSLDGAAYPELLRDRAQR